MLLRAGKSFRPPDSRLENPGSRTQVLGKVAEASGRLFPQWATRTWSPRSSALPTPRVHAQGHIDPMCRRDVVSRLARGPTQGQGTNSGQARWAVGRAEYATSRGTRGRTRAFLAVKKHTQNRLGESGRRRACGETVENTECPCGAGTGQAKVQPGQHQRGKTGTCFGRQEREPYHGVAHPVSSGPSCHGCHHPFFFCLPSAPPEPTAPSGWFGVYPPCLLGSHGPQVPAYLPYQHRTLHGLCTMNACVLVCLVCPRAALWPPAVPGLERRERRPRQTTYRAPSHPLPLSHHTRVLVGTRHAVPSILAACPVVWSGRRIQGALPRTRETFGGLVLVDFDTGLNLSKAAGLASGQRVPRRTTLAPVPLTLYSFSAFCPRRNMPTCPPALPTCPYQTLPVLASPTCLPSIH